MDIREGMIFLIIYPLILKLSETFKLMAIRITHTN